LGLDVGLEEAWLYIDEASVSEGGAREEKITELSAKIIVRVVCAILCAVCK